MSIYESETTMNVLLDVAATRREEEEILAAAGLTGQGEKVQDGLEPSRAGDAVQAIMNALIKPTWTNAMLAQVLVAGTCKNTKTLRACLVKVAALAVAWIENIDAREKKD